MEELEAQLKALIVKSLALEDVEPESIDAEAPLFGGGLGLDSIDALELAVVLNREFGLALENGDEGNRAIFSSVRSLATYIRQHGAA